MIYCYDEYLGGILQIPGRMIFAQRNYDMKRGLSCHQPAEEREDQDAVNIPPIIARNP